MKRKLRNKTHMPLLTAALATLAISTSAHAQLYMDLDTGPQNWDTTNVLWGTASGSLGDVAWTNGSDAIFQGTPGTMTLTEAITANDITFTAASSGYSIEGFSLDLTGGTITNSIANTNHTITSAITGSPDVMIEDGTSSTLGMTFAPTSGSQVLGTCTVPYDNGAGDKCGLTLGGTTTGNSVSMLQFLGGQRWGKVYKKGSGTWTVGAANLGYFDIEDGVLIATGSIEMTASTTLNLTGGELHYNNDAAVTGSKGWNISGGAVDNTSGAAIVSTTSPPQIWSGNWTFIGSNGALSDLTLDGAVTLTGDRTVTVTNVATTLTIDGAIGDSTNIYGVTKAGDGTLALTAANSYNGATTVSAGMLSLGDGTNNSSLDDDAVVEVTSGAKLDLNFASVNVDDVFLLTLNGSAAALGTWGSTDSTATNTDNAYFSGTGVINNLGGLAPAGTNYWDGSNIGGTGDGASDGGSGTWDTSTLNWDQGFVSRVAWPNTSADKAIFSAPAGTVTLGSDITLNEILIEGANNYTIGDNPEANSLNFDGTAPKITVDSVIATIRAGITGSPDIHTPGGHQEKLYLTPDSADMTIGTIHHGLGSGSNPQLFLRGSTHGNTVNMIQKEHTYSFLYLDGTGTWTIGDLDLGVVYFQSGTLIVNGTWDIGWSDFKFQGGTLGGTGTINESVNVPVGGGLTFDLSTDAASHDKLEIGGGTNALGFVGASELTITSSGGASPGVYTLVSGVGSITGVAPATVNLPVDWAATVSISGADLILTVTSTGGVAAPTYASWASGAAADIDSNNDGVSNGAAWALGAADENANAIGLLPTLDNSDPLYVIFNFNRSDEAEADATTAISVQYGSDLVGWTTAVHDGTNVIIGVVDGSPTDAVELKLLRSALVASDKFFARLNVVVTP